MDYAIGIDLGGTNIKAVMVSESGELLGHHTCQTEDDSAANWAGLIRRQIEEFERRFEQQAMSIGLAAPGLVAPDGRSITSMPGRLEGLEGLVWADFLKVERPVPVLNDAHAALLGEVWKGAATGCRDVVLLTLGTGVGGAILTDGRLLRGHIGRGGHLGHLCLNPDGAPDIVGMPGSLEDAIGNCTLAARSEGRFTTTRQLVGAYLAGDPKATEIWLRSVFQLACAVASMINALDPEVIILGGGIARAGPALFEPLDGFLEKVEWRPDGHRVRIVPATLGEIAGALGAAYNAINAMHDTGEDAS